jgi:drug/metabolite transporter (DMT)-like permease
MLGSGIAWGVYSLRGKGAGNPTRATAGNFLRAAPIAAALSMLMHDGAFPESAGFWYAVASTVLTSGIGHAIW